MLRILFSTTVNQPAMQFPFQMLPPVNGFHQGVTSLPYSAARPVIALPSTERNQAVTRPPRRQMWQPWMDYTQPAPTMQNIAQQTASTVPPATTPMYNVASTSTSSQNITEAILGQHEKSPQDANDVFHLKSEPSAKKTKHESTSSYKPALGQPLVNTFIYKSSFTFLITYYFLNESISGMH